METVDTEALKHALINTSELIVDSEPELTEIDTVIGDGDHGLGMKNGFNSMKEMLELEDFDSPYDLFHACGICLIKNMGGTSGVLFGTLFIGGLNLIKNKQALSCTDIVDFFDKGYGEICRRGRAKLGDKTMIDALEPAIKGMRGIATDETNMHDLLFVGYKGALAGVENTKKMLPHQGRSKNFREKALGWPDPGAVSVSLLFKGMSEGVR